MAFCFEFLDSEFIVSQHDHAMLAEAIAAVLLHLIYPQLDPELKEKFLAAVRLHDWAHGKIDQDDILGGHSSFLRPVGDEENAGFVRLVLRYAKESTAPPEARISILLHWRRLITKWSPEKFAALADEIDNLVISLAPNQDILSSLSKLDRIMDIADGISLRVSAGLVGDYKKDYYPNWDNHQIKPLPYRIKLFEQGGELWAEVKLYGLPATEERYTLPYYPADEYGQDHFQQTMHVRLVFES